MSINTLIAIVINIGVLLIASWILGLYIIKGLSKENKRLHKELNTLRKTQKAPSSAAVNPGNTADLETMDTDSTDHFILINEMAQEIQDKEARINQLLSIKNNQQEAQQFLHTLDPSEDMTSYLDQLEADFEKTEHIIVDLQKDLDTSRRKMASMEEDILAGENRSERVFALEKSEHSLRDENKNLRDTGIQIAEKLDTRNKQINQLQENNTKLKKTIASLTNASKEQLAVISKLHAQIERAEQLENHQRQLITDLEKRLNTEKNDQNDLEKVNVMETELKDLRGTLQRTLIEKEFIEEHMMELDDTLEKAKETEAALARAQKEIETLEKHFPDFEPETPTQTPAIKPAFTTDIPELQNIMENHRLFGSVQAFWMTLDLPPITLIEQQPVPVPTINDWVLITIGNNDYTVLLTIDTQLAETVTQAIFKGDNEAQEQKDTTGELCNIVAGTLATELNSDFPVSVPQHIQHDEAQTLLSNANVISEILLTSRQQPFYLAFITTPA